MAEGRTDEIADANEEWNDLLEQQTEIEALQGQCRGNLCFISSSCSRVWCLRLGIYDDDMTIIKKDTEYKVSVW